MNADTKYLEIPETGDPSDTLYDKWAKVALSNREVN